MMMMIMMMMMRMRMMMMIMMMITMKMMNTYDNEINSCLLKRLKFIGGGVIIPLS